jgi:hypothetical protein
MYKNLEQTKMTFFSKSEDRNINQAQSRGWYQWEG